MKLILSLIVFLSLANVVFSDHEKTREVIISKTGSWTASAFEYANHVTGCGAFTRNSEMGGSIYGIYASPGYLGFSFWYNDHLLGIAKTAGFSFAIDRLKPWSLGNFDAPVGGWISGTFTGMPAKTLDEIKRQIRKGSNLYHLDKSGSVIQRFSLNGSSAAIDALEQCIRNEYGKSLFLTSDGKAKSCPKNAKRKTPLFQCSFNSGKKEVTVCQSGDAEMEYAFGIIGGDTQMKLNSLFQEGFVPVDEGSFSKVHQLWFYNNETSYKIVANASPSSGKGWDQPNYSGFLYVIRGWDDDGTVIAKLECDEGSITNEIWDGAITNNLEMMGLCFQAEETEEYLANSWVACTYEDALEPAMCSEANNVSASFQKSKEFIKNILFSAKDRGGSLQIKTDRGTVELPLDGLRDVWLKYLEGKTECFGEWCSFYSEENGGWIVQADANQTGVMPAFDKEGNIWIEEEYYSNLMKKSETMLFGRSVPNDVLEITLRTINKSGKFQELDLGFDLWCAD